MIIILDTNVVISSLFFSRTLTPILANWASGTFRFALTKEIAEEYIDVYERMSLKYERLLEPTFQSILVNSDYFEPTKLSTQICKDADDDMFLSCALSSRARFVVTGDKLLLAVGKIGSTNIVTPRAFIEFLRKIPG